MRKRLLAIVATVAMVLTMIPSMAFAAESITINNVDELKAFAANVNNGESYEGKTITLASDIDLSNEKWTPIGNGVRSGASYSGNAFKGTFDGNGNTITGLTITTNPNAAGLFGILDAGTVKNLTFKNVNIDTDSENTGAAVGLMVNNATVECIKVESGSITAPDGVGGIVGRMTVSGTISNCENAAVVTATSETAGGIVGKAYYTEAGAEMNITKCSNTGVVKAVYAAGGIAGMSAANVSECTNTAAITAGTEAGGIIAEQVNYGEVKNNTNSGVISNGETEGTTYGGIIGWIRYQNSASYANSEVITVIGNVNSGIISAEGCKLGAGGIVGSIYNQATVTGNKNKAESITGGVFAAGVVGNLQENTDNKVIEGAIIKVTDNISVTTDITATTKGCTDKYAYNNNAAKFVVENNTDVWPQEPEQNPTDPTPGDDETTAPTDPTKPATGTPQTGDDFNMTVPFALAGLAVAAMAAVVATRRKQNQK